MSALKDLYSIPFYDRFASVLERTLPDFNREHFIAQIFDAAFAQKELKARMHHTALALHQFLPADFGAATGVLTRIIRQLQKEQFGEDSLVFMFFPDYIETFGLNDYDHAIQALEETTQFVSCEFAVRPFILKYGVRMLFQMTSWSLHPNHKVRRLASEGSRPRLPWAMGLPALKKDPAPILPLLDNLKNDPSEWVRRSVANNLNDIAKDHPQIVLDIARKWKGISKETDAIIKHGSRTLLKKGHAEILSHYGLDNEGLEWNDFTVITPTVKITEVLQFRFAIANTGAMAKTVRLEYALYYNKANGQLSKKVFKISERIFQPGQSETITRNQSFRIITTRKFYTGAHKVSLIINGSEKELLDFELIS